MNTLSKNWLTEDWIDFEYKQYILLDYLQNLQNYFASQCLYPLFADAIEHYKEIQKAQQGLLQPPIKKDIIGINKNSWQFVYNESCSSEWIQELQKIIYFAIPLLQKSIQEGQKLYQKLKQDITINVLGLHASYIKEGYLLLHILPENKVKVYQYQLCLWEEKDEKYRSLRTNFITDFAINILSQPENIKAELIQSYPSLPCPATYYITSKCSIPFQESYLPIAKRMLLEKMIA